MGPQLEGKPGVPDLYLKTKQKKERRVRLMPTGKKIRITKVH
jgi:hypothetical protein